jgi:hypothetical protein
MDQYEQVNKLALVVSISLAGLRCNNGTPNQPEGVDFRIPANGIVKMVRALREVCAVGSITLLLDILSLLL